MKLFVLTIMIGAAPVLGAQTIVLTETVIPDLCYAVHSPAYCDNSLQGTANIYVIKGAADTVWLFGLGYDFYSNPCSEPQDEPAAHDAREIYFVVTEHFNMKPTQTQLAVILPNPYIQLPGDEERLASGGMLERLGAYGFPIDSLQIHGNWEQGIPDTNTDTLNLQLVNLGSETDTCRQTLKTITTPYGYWYINSTESGSELALNDPLLKLTLTQDTTCSHAGTVEPMYGDVLARSVSLSVLTTDTDEPIYIYPSKLETEVSLVFPHVPVTPTSPWTIIVKNKAGEAVIEDTTSTDRYIIKREDLEAETHTLEIWYARNKVVSGKLGVR